MNIRKHKLPTLLVLSLLWIYNPAYPRDGDDWVLVERFEAQLKKAQTGDSQAMYDVGVMYELGRGTPAQPAKAIEWLERAEQNDHRGARARLGAHYYEGKLVARDLGKARGLLQKAAGAGEPSAQYYLGQMYEAGEGVSADPQQALNLYKEAASNGHYEARARANTLQARLAAIQSAPPAPAPAPVATPAKPRTTVLDTLLTGNWQRNNRSAGFLPSTGTQCDRVDTNTLQCLSGTQQRDTGYAVVTYVTQSVITHNGQGNNFDVQYTNIVLNTADTQKQAAPDADANVKSSISKGQQTEHLLQCKLETAATITCVKDRVTTQTYQNAAKGQ